MKLTTRIALVTGASSGIGQAIAIALAQAGCSVVINYYRNPDGAKKTLAACNKYNSQHQIIRCDVSKPEAIATMMKTIRRTCGHLDIVVNNAGIFDAQDSPVNLVAFDRVFRHNFLGATAVVKYALPLMTRGKIINISSIHGRLGHGRPTAIAYSAMKAALDSYTKNLAKALAPRILVNAIAPGRVLTAMWGHPTARQQKKLGEALLIRRMIKPEEIAQAAVFLAQNDALCGEIMTVDGGQGLVALR